MNYAAKYIEEFNLKSTAGSRGGLTTLWHVRGKNLPPPDGSLADWPTDLTPQERQLGLGGIREKYLAPALNELAALIDPANATWPTEAIARFDGMSFGELLRSSGASPAAVELLRIADSDYIGEAADVYSALGMIGQGYNIRALGRFLKGPFIQIAGGNDLLPRAFADRLGNRIRYSAAASRIERSETSVTVHFRQSGREESATGDFAICAIPFSVLRSLSIRPAFSAAKSVAIRELSHTSLARTYIQCKQRFWIDRGFSGSVSTDLATTYFWESSAGQPGARGILQGYIMGPRANAFGRLSASQRRAFAMAQAAAVFPEVSAQAETVQSIAWDDEPFSRGGYAFLKPGDGKRLFPYLATPEGRVHFAGGHTSTWFLHGSMQGALESGIRAARAIDRL